MAKYLGIALDYETHDLHLAEDGKNLAMVEDTAAVAELVKQRLLTYKGEWFIDIETGQPWFSHQDRQLVGILDRPYNEVVAAALIKRAILETKGVVELLSFQMEARFRTRELAVINADVRSEFDQVVTVTI